VWYARGELARDSEALHPRWGVLYKSGVYARNVLGLTLGDLPVVPSSGLRAGRPALTGREKSAEGKVGRGNEPGKDPGGLTSPKARTVPCEGMKREELPPSVEPGHSASKAA
jgi:hypothetical protein